LYNQGAYLLSKIQPSMRILDAGCRPGSLTADFAHIVTLTGDVVGVNIHLSSLEQARQLAEQRQLNHIDF